MADIELVIKIPEDVFKRTVFYREFRDLNDCVTTIKALEKAVSLPKGHGRLVDEKDLSLMTVHMIDGVFVCDAPTIIEANKAESEVQE